MLISNANSYLYLRASLKPFAIAGNFEKAVSVCKGGYEAGFGSDGSGVKNAIFSLKVAEIKLLSAVVSADLLGENGGYGERGPDVSR